MRGEVRPRSLQVLCRTGDGADECELEVTVKGDKLWPSSGHTSEAESVGFAKGLAVLAGAKARRVRGRSWTQALVATALLSQAVWSLLSAPLSFSHSRPQGPCASPAQALPVFLGLERTESQGTSSVPAAPPFGRRGRGAPRGSARRKQAGLLRSPGSGVGLLTICGEGTPALCFYVQLQGHQTQALVSIRFSSQGHSAR